MEAESQEVFPAPHDYSEFIGLSGDLVAIYSESRSQTDVYSLTTKKVVVAFNRQLSLLAQIKDMIICDS